VIIARVSEEQIPPYRPDINAADTKVNPILVTMMNNCWAEEPTDRLSFDEVLKLMKKLNNGK
jgi:hypothetical protein